MFSADEQRLRTELLEVWELIRNPGTDIPEPVREAVAAALAMVGRPERNRGQKFREETARRT